MGIAVLHHWQQARGRTLTVSDTALHGRDDTRYIKRAAKRNLGRGGQDVKHVGKRLARFAGFRNADQLPEWSSVA